jgi:hypothetical protein
MYKHGLSYFCNKDHYVEHVLKDVPKMPKPIKSKKVSRSSIVKTHMNNVANLGCIVCRNNGILDSPAELHHIRAGAGAGKKSSDFEVIPLCFNHHSAQGIDGFHKHPRTWQKKHGTEVELLEQVEKLLCIK